MFLQNDQTTGFCAPFDDTHFIPDVRKVAEQNNGLEIDGSGRLQIVNTGGSSAAEGGMGSGSDNEKEKGDLTSNMEETGSTKTANDPNKSWDPVKDNIDEETSKRSGKE